MKRIRPAPMGRAYRYQRRLTHIVLSVAERDGAAGLVTKVEEPAVAPKAAKTEEPQGGTQGNQEEGCGTEGSAKTAAKEGRGAAGGNQGGGKDGRQQQRQGKAGK